MAISQKYEKEGFIILGIFNSYARGEATKNSDVDILYEVTNMFYKRYPGWEVYPVIEKIEKDLEKKLKYKVDLSNKNALNKIGKKYILPEVIYV